MHGKMYEVSNCCRPAEQALGIIHGLTFAIPKHTSMANYQINS